MTLGRPRAPRRRRPAAAAWLLVAVGALLAGCAQDSKIVPGARPSSGPSVYPIIPPDSGTAQMVDAGGPGAARAVVKAVELANGVRLPNPDVTPGSFYPDVTAKDICDRHYTLGVRGPRYNTKVEAFANYGVALRERDVYQVDQLVPVVLGGNSAIENVWPQPIDDAFGATAKDRLERQLRALVCSGKLTLSEAQQAIAKNWWTAYGTYLGAADPISKSPAYRTRPQPAEGDVVKGAPCPEAGQVGYTKPKGIRMTCAASGGELRWGKRS